MAFQPDNCKLNYSISFSKELYLCCILGSEDLTENSFIDFDQYLFSPNGFRDQYGDLALSQGRYHRRTPFELRNLYDYRRWTINHT
jgi:hypothetical protein